MVCVSGQTGNMQYGRVSPAIFVYHIVAVLFCISLGSGRGGELLHQKGIQM